MRDELRDRIDAYFAARKDDEGRELLRKLGMPFRGLPVEGN